MSPKSIAIAVIALVVTIETSIAIWRATPAKPVATGSFEWPWPQEISPDPVHLARAIQVYGADQGWERQTVNADGLKMTAHFFQWAKVKTGPMMIISGHTPKECNAAAGFALVAEAVRLKWNGPNGDLLQFHSSEFKTPNGGSLFVFKTAWLQGLGSITLNPGSDRIERVKGSLHPIVGEGRVLQAGIFGADNEKEAWNYFQTEILQRLVWKQ